MFSLPMIAPRPDATLWPSHLTPNSPLDDTSHSPPQTSHTHRHPYAHHGHNHHHAQARSSSAFLAALTNDENIIEQRKLNVRRFGAGWLRPPGVSKTLQARQDELLEKEEQEMMQRREQVMLDLAAAQQDGANEEARERGEQDADGDAEQERDLDDSIPDAADGSDTSVSGSESDADASNPDPDGADTTVPFNEDSFIEGSMLDAHVSQMLELEEAEIAGVLQDERDLDDDVPEAGEYEHTDSELEDESDVDGSSLLVPPSIRSRRESGRRVSSGRRRTRRSSGLPGGILGTAAVAASITASAVTGSGTGRISLGADLGHGRSSFGVDGSSSILDGSSFLRSSPAVTTVRGSLRDRFLGAARGGRRA